jgi:hypothetical protein
MIAFHATSQPDRNIDGGWMAANSFRVSPDQLDALADRVGPLTASLREDAAGDLGRANQASAGNPGYYTSAALDYACQQLRLTFDGLADQLTAYQRAAKSNADGYRSGDERIRQHLSQFFDQL